MLFILEWISTLKQMSTLCFTNLNSYIYVRYNPQYFIFVFSLLQFIECPVFLNNITQKNLTVEVLCLPSLKSFLF